MTATRDEFLASFLPGSFLGRLPDEPPDGPTETTVLGAALSADIVGSTALGELLDATHPEGVDVLSRALQRMYEQVDGVIAAHGGELVYVAGDGVFALWEAADEGDLGRAAATAVACGLAVQERLSGSTVDDTRSLAFRVGVGAGSFWLPTVGGEPQWTVLIGGDPVAQIAEALDAARPGEVVVSGSARDRAGDAITVQSAGGVHRAVSSGADARPLVPAAPAGPPDRFIFEHVVRRADAGLLGPFAELRTLTSVFAKVSGVDGDAGRLQRITTAFQREVGRRDGAVTATLLDENGLSLIGTWGGSGHAHEDNEVRGLLAATDFAAAVDDPHVGIGVSTGKTFMGDLTSDRSRRFLILGKSINRAARLAGADPGREVRCDLDTMTGARRQVSFEELQPVHLKGLPGETRIFRPVGRTPARTGSGLVGRRVEQELLGGLLAGLGNGTRSVAFVEGDAGVGKTALVDDLVRQGSSMPIRRLVLEGSALERSTPLQPWGRVFADLMGRSTVDAAIEEALGEDDQPFLSLLAPTIPVRAAATPEADALDPAARVDVVRSMLLRILESLVGDAPLLLVAEDSHWFDSSTWALLDEAVDRLPDVLLLAATRPVAEMDPAEESLRARAFHVHVGPLDQSETVALVCEQLDVAAVPDRFAALIAERSEGNPLFAEQVVRSLVDAGAVEITGTGREVSIRWEEVERAAVPASVTGVIASRVDRLPLAHQSTLKVASVIGRTFTGSDLLAIHPDRLPVTGLAAQLGDIVAAGLLRADPENADVFHFSHALTAEATYGLLTAEDRASLHAAFAGLLDRPRTIDDALLAHHHAAAGNLEEAASALDRAAERAFASAAYREVIELIGRLWALGAEQAPPGVQARREALVGEAHVNLGNLRVGRDHLVAATKHAGMALPGRRLLGFGLVGQVLRQVAHRYLPLPRLVEGHRADRIRVGAEAYFAMATQSYGEDPIGLTYVGLRATNEAERIAASRALVNGYSFVSYALGVAGRDAASSRYRDRALAAADEMANPTARGETLLFHAVMLVSRGHWSRADEHLDEAQSLFARVGNRRWHAHSVEVQAYCRLQQGRFAEALEAYRSVDAIGTEDALSRAWQARGTGQALLFLGRVNDAVGVLEALLPEARRVGELPTIAATLGLLAIGFHQQGRVDEATRLALEGLEQLEGTESLSASHSTDGFTAVARVLLEASAATTDAVVGEAANRAVRSLGKASERLAIARPRAATYRAVLDARRGRTDRARAGFEEAYREATGIGMAYEAAIARFEGGRSLGDPEWLAEAADAFEALGSVEEARLARMAQPG